MSPRTAGEGAARWAEGAPARAASPAGPLAPPALGKINMGPDASKPLAPGEVERAGPEAPDRVGKLPITFRWTEPASSVLLAGSFTEWQQQAEMERGLDGTWYVIQYLAPGVYEYKFIVDGNWRYSPDQPTKRDMNGNINNVIMVTAAGPAEATRDPGAREAAQSGSADPRARAASRSISEGRIGAVNKFFTCEVPERPAEYWNTYPVEIPRQLSKTPLNDSVTPDGFVPTALLAIPEHIVLTHYFHQRKKRGVAVSAATGRHRSKYVTAVLYSATEPVEEFAGLADAILSYVP